MQRKCLKKFKSSELLAKFSKIVYYSTLQKKIQMTKNKENPKNLEKFQYYKNF
jgi:hypothetical protein